MNAKFVVDKNNLNRVGKVLTQAKNNYKIIGNQIVDTNAEIFYHALINNIESQSIKWKPLNPDYKERKGLLGLDSRILIATGEYLSAIQIKRIYKTGDTVERHVGVDSSRTHSSGLKMSDLAIIMEYGTSDGRLPPRSHYATTWRQVIGEIKTNTLMQARSMFRY